MARQHDHASAVAARSGMRAAALPSAAAPQRPSRRLACACGGVCPSCSRPGDAIERQADRWADGVAPTLPRLPASASGAPLPARAAFEDRFGSDLSAVRLHHDAAAQQRSAMLGARAFTQGDDIFFGAGEYAPGSARGRHLLAHEVAHTLQPRARGVIARKTLTDLPQSVRLVIQVSRTAPAPADVQTWVKNYFDASSGISATPGVPVEFGTEISDAQQKKGLGAVVNELMSVSHVVVTPATPTTPEERSNTDPENWPLGPNSLLDLALDLRAHGGEHAVFRFTRYSDAGTEKVLVEKTRVLAAAGTTASVAPATTGTFTGGVAVGKIRLQIDSTFGDDRGKRIADAVALLPEMLRDRADGLSFVDGGAGQGPGGENGHYDAATDQVSLYGDLFAASVRQVGAASSSAYQIVHEIGHVVDLRPLFAAQRARDAAKEAKKKLEAPKPFDINDTDIFAGEKKPDPAAQAEIARLKTEIDTQNKLVASAKSVAGSEVGTATESMLTEFAKALAADGVTAVKDAKKRNAATEAANVKAQAANEADPSGVQKPIRPLEPTLSTGLSRYAATDLMEAYAENYALYVLDETLLQALRPKTHAYFVKAFPKAPPAAPGGV